MPEEVRKTLVDALRVDIPNRPQKILINWVETLSSPPKEDAVDARMVRVATPTRALQAPQAQTLTVNKIDHAVLYHFTTTDTGTQGHVKQGSLSKITILSFQGVIIMTRCPFHIHVASKHSS